MSEKERKKPIKGGRGGMGASDAGRLVIANRIILARTQAGLTAAHLARLLNVSPQTMSYIENGQQRINTDILERVSVALGKPVRWFLGDMELADRYRSADVLITELTQIIKDYLPVYDSVEEYAKVTGNVPVLQEGLAVAKLKAFRIYGVHCEPMVRDGDILVVDTKMKAVPGAHVLFKHQGKAHCGLYGLQKGHHYLATVSETWNFEDVQVVGVVVQLTRSIIPGTLLLPPPASK